MHNRKRPLLTRVPLLKTLWRELFLRPGWYADSYEELEKLFQWCEDPWNFENSAYEKERLECLLTTLKRYPHKTILEVGCAEGVFTSYLQKLDAQVVAIDVSLTALSRAKQRHPHGVFIHSSLEDFSWSTKFDMVICSETLYYMANVPEAIDKLRNLGKYCLVSYIHRESKNLDQYFFQLPLKTFERFEKSYWLWKRAMSVAVWENS